MLLTVAVCCHAAAVVSASPLDDVMAVKRTPENPMPLRGRLELFPLTDEYIAIAGVYDAFFNDRIMAAYRKRLTLAEKLEAEGSLKSFSLRFFYNFATADVLADYLPVMRDNFQNPDYFAVTVNHAPVKVVAHGYWINAVGVKRLPRASRPGTELVSSAELAPFAYLKLEKPLKNGDRLCIATRDGDRAELLYDDLRTISRAIKVNQVGYAAEAGEKYAYFGMWLGELGALPAAAFAGRPFHLRRTADNAVVFSGELKLRSPEQFIRRDDVAIPLHGEEVMEMDFSAFAAPGEYFVQIPGVGRSWSFVVGDDAVGRAFYVQTRGLFLQRSGIAKTAPFTQWTMGPDHPVSYRGGFVPNDRHYKGKGGRFVDRSGKTVDVKHFDMVRATATDEVLPGVRGGWWDAGDFDRRPYHFEAVDALLSVYLLFPENFQDGQLDLPESGNGVPDIVDEAAWGVDVWRRAQNADGGVGCWLEATSHPENPDPVLDVQRYYLAIPTRESTIQYTAHAARLARAYRRCGRAELAELFYRSAAAGWRFAMNPANRAVTDFNHPKLGKLHYSEPETLPPEMVFKAALNLYLYSKDAEYAKVLDLADIDRIIENLLLERSAYFLSELAEEEAENSYFIYSGKYRKAVRKRADKWLASQRELAYRNVNWELKSGFFLFLGWGAGLPFAKGSYLIMAWRTTGDVRYRDAALLCFDWMMGANPMGRSMTTGLGQVYPVRLLSLPMWAWRDRLVDPLPGLTPYTFSGENNYSASRMIFRFEHKPRPDHRFAGCEVNLMPKSLGGGRAMSQKECAMILQRTIPVWRRFANLEGYAVNQNEFSVWETMAPAAAAYGALLRPGWMPPKDWRAQKPEPDVNRLPGYIFLP